MSMQDSWNQLKAWAEAKLTAVEGGVEAFVEKVEPVIEADVEATIREFGEALIGDAVDLLTNEPDSTETASKVATSLIQKVEAQGKTIVLATANTVAGQVVAAARTQAGAMAQ